MEDDGKGGGIGERSREPLREPIILLEESEVEDGTFS
jgi:hypothetical protein